MKSCQNTASIAGGSGGILGTGGGGAAQSREGGSGAGPCQIGCWAGAMSISPSFPIAQVSRPQTNNTEQA